MLIAWTTVENRADADRLASGLIEARLAACVQIDGPITSHYRWEGRVAVAEEFRLTIKFMADRQPAVGAWVQRHHPYENPEWLVVAVEHVAEKYLSWAQANSNSPPL